MGDRRSLTFALLVAVVASLLAVAPAGAASLATRVRFIETDRKIIALTFDDGWSPTRSLQIAQILDEYEATGTFFPYANAVAGAASTWRAIAARFPIANHTVSHPNMKRLSATAMFEEIDGARRMIERATGRPMVRIFRPPYMEYNESVQEQSYRAGFEIMALWSVDSGDSIGLSADRVFKRAIIGQAGGIVLLHAGPPATVKALPKIIENYRSRGFTFVTLPELLGIPWSPTTTVGSLGPPPPQPPKPSPPVLSRWAFYIRPSAAFRAAPE